MDKDSILKLSKKEICQFVENLTLENLDETKMEIEKYLVFLQNLKSLAIVSKEKIHSATSNTINIYEDEIIEEVENTETRNVDTDIQITSGPNSEEEISNQTTNYEVAKTAEADVDAKEDKEDNTLSSMYLVERKLRGAICPEINAFIPEGIVRNYEIEHGDYVYAKLIGPNRYLYELARKGEGSGPEDRVQLNFCIVEKDGSMLITKRSVINGDIKLDGVPYIFLLSEEEVRKMEIKEGDIIDIAFYEDNPQGHKIIWKQIDFQQEFEKTSGIKNNSNKKNKKEKNDIEKADLPLSLSDKTILVIGNEPKKVLYQESIEGRGGTFLWADAKDNFTHLEAVVRKSDMVFFLLKVSGHTGMKEVKAYCKRYKKPFLTTFSNGWSSMVKTAEEILIS